MSRHHRKLPTLFTTGTAIAALVWTGCSTDPLSTSPAGGDHGSVGTADFGTPTGNAEIGSPKKDGRPEGWDTPFDIDVPADDIAPGLPDEADYVPDAGWASPPQSGFTEKVLQPNTGGSVEFGIAELDVPPGAVKAQTNFQVQILEHESIRVRLLPHGLQFDEPVTLTLDLSSATGLGKNVALYWFDEDAKDWVNIGGQYDPKTRTLTTKLAHFSDYAPGRAGWRGSGPGKPNDSAPDGKKGPKSGTK